MGIAHNRRLGDRTIKMLGLDLAGRTGYAALFGHGLLKIGTLQVTRGADAKSGKRNPFPAARLWRRLNLLSDHFNVKCVVFEETFARGNAKYRLDSMQFAVTLWAITNGINWARITPGGWKKRMIGKGNLTRGEYLAAAREKWPEVNFRFDDEAAARWLLEYGLLKGEQQ